MEFIPGCVRTIVVNGKHEIIESEDDDKSYKIMEEIYNCINQNNLIRFIELYPLIVYNSSITTHIYYNEWDYMTTPPTEIYYTYCNCNNELFKIHKHLYCRECNCKYGKKYMLLKHAYENEIGKQYKNDTLLNKKKVEKTKKKYESNILPSYISFQIRDLLSKYVLSNKNDIINFLETVDDIPVNYNYRQWIITTKYLWIFGHDYDYDLNENSQSIKNKYEIKYDYQEDTNEWVLVTSKKQKKKTKK
jgi:hypothetical protein